ncbi:hypothetical protein FC83_GL002082 [Agrilactobacillus composti DSM 18527 = JCM 14202]|uniref:Short-chain dehydrogenase reductase SDR n=1 Tax=Agrilactobacillus composti DSM 18527 = JCM 14202 TaxID=1423734 RepID=X0PD41_9LACO|nr:SDR family NAD(P)-dependent oxidoreductase [Agrilactobacillus composti]KRM34941.1 hypothetical protein FC83_GL002082 [Agrilactobacillus composti DSM 18527 = JCM 14202]GAF38834.1 short-chain dehydrogenase/reductase SDR [Agrilactobacillus composti DSM 18527 = JCM 14202]
MTQTLVLVGIGKSGLGEAIIKRFAQANFKIILMGRNQAKLLATQTKLATEQIPVTIQQLNLTDSDSIRRAFSAIDQIDVLIYNAVARRSVESKDLSRQAAERDFAITVGGAIDCVQAALSKLNPENSAILFTGGGVALKPAIANSSMSLDKAALRNYAFGLAKNLQQRHVYVGTVTITQGVRPDSDYAPDKISAAYWQLYQVQPQNFEIII